MDFLNCHQILAVDGPLWLCSTMGCHWEADNASVCVRERENEGERNRCYIRCSYLHGSKCGAETRAHFLPQLDHLLQRVKSLSTLWYPTCRAHVSEMVSQESGYLISWSFCLPQPQNFQGRNSYGEKFSWRNGGSGLGGEGNYFWSSSTTYI